MDAISDDNRKEISRALGEALVRIWGSLPAEIQRHLFEEAVTAQGENLRSPLAAFLHNYHPRTCASVKARAMLEPDSLGG